MFKVLENLCTGCGVCVSECPNRVICVKDGKAAADPEKFCMECGHCIAVCPADAACLEGFDKSECQPGSLAQTALSPDDLMRAIKGRRSIRRYQDRPVEQEKLNRIIESGRFTATAGNRQSNSYVVFQGESLAQFRELAFESLFHAADGYLADKNSSPVFVRYAHRFKLLGKIFRESGGKIDGLFFNAPVVIGICTSNPVDAGLAASNMELMAYALGLGALYTGFTVRAAENSLDIRDLLGLRQDERLTVAMLVGYPDTDFLRGVPRKPARVKYLGALPGPPQA